MKCLAQHVAVVAGLLGLADITSAAEPLGTVFAYQGDLHQNGSPVTALSDFQFSLWDAGSEGLRIGATQAVNNVRVSNGLFKVELDFGANAFNGDARWLELAVRQPAGTGAFTRLTPRQAINAVPYALVAQRTQQADQAATVTGSVPAAQLSGTISSTNLAAGSIGSDKLAPGSVTAEILAAGAVTQDKLASTVQEGTELEAELIGISADRAELAVRFSSPLPGSPVVTFDATEWMLESVSATGFVARVSFKTQNVDPGDLSPAGTALVVANGRPAISYYDWGLDRRLRFAYAADAHGNGPWTISTIAAEIGGEQTSVALMSGKPALGFAVGWPVQVLKYAYAADAQGNGPWTIRTVDTQGSPGRYCSLAAVNGKPAIAYIDTSTYTLKFASANDAEGAGPWNILTVDPSGRADSFVSLALVNGRPAISYGVGASAYQLRYAYAADAQGNGPWTIRVVDAGGVAYYSSLAVVNGKPAIAYRDQTTLALKFAYAAEAQGDGPWTLLVVDPADTAGAYASLAVINGRPAISYLAEKPAWHLKFALAADAQGSGPWTNLSIVDPGGQAGTAGCLGVVNGKPAISHCGFAFTNNHLKFTSIPALHWQATDTSLPPLGGTFTGTFAGTHTGTFAGAARGDFTGTYNGDGGAITNVSATNLVGQIPADRLSTNVAFLDRDQIFSGDNQFTSPANRFWGSFTGVVEGDGVGLTNLSATTLTGQLPDARLSVNVALLDSSPTFSGTVRAAALAGHGAEVTNLNAGNLTGGLVPDGRLAGSYTGPLQFDNPSNSYLGRFFGDGSGLTNVGGTGPSDGWLLSGNSGPPAAKFLGTTDNQPLELRVNNRRALRIEPSAGETPTWIGGYGGNLASPGVNGATIGGGGGSAMAHAIEADFGTVAGGRMNKIESMGLSASIGGGEQNTISSSLGTIGGGRQNTIPSPWADAATISGGSSNTILGPSTNATIGGGTGNLISGDTALATIPGGSGASASKFGQMAYASGSFASPGDAQTSVYVLRGTSRGSVSVELFLDGSSRRMTLPGNATWSFDILVVGRRADGASAGYHFQGVIKNGTGTTQLVGPVAKTVLGQDQGWDASVQADDAMAALVVKVTGGAGATIRWVAASRTAEVAF